MQHNLVGVIRVIGAVAFAPIVSDSIGEDRSRTVEGSGHDATTYPRVALESVFGVLVPKVESPITACCAEGSVLRME